jgi:hypothetical protein
LFRLQRPAHAAAASRAERPPKIHHFGAGRHQRRRCLPAWVESRGESCYSLCKDPDNRQARTRASAWGRAVAMDWDAKMLPAWDLGTVVGPSSSGGGALDLKLGAPTSSRAVLTAAAGAAPALPSANPPPPPPPPSSSAPAKRPRPGLARQAVPACSVQGCDADLSRCRDYHRRHKVCEAHSKTPVVTVAGQQQRFCQQCSRYAYLCPAVLVRALRPPGARPPHASCSLDFGFHSLAVPPRPRAPMILFWFFSLNNLTTRRTTSSLVHATARRPWMAWRGHGCRTASCMFSSWKHSSRPRPRPRGGEFRGELPPRPAIH